MQRRHSNANQQSGATLLVALMFLVIMAMLGVSIANVTTLQERMAGNTRDRDLALQAAEAALHDAEQNLSDPAFRAKAIAFDKTNANDQNFWEDCFTKKTSPCTAPLVPSGTNALPTSGSGAVAEQPRYVLEKKANIGTMEIYRVTARAVGGAKESVVVLQSEFGYTP